MLPGGHKIHYEYDDMLRPKAIKAVDAGGQPLHTLNYEYDKVNNITRKGVYLGIKGLDHRFGLVDYGYNLLDRLEDVDYSDEINLHETFGQVDEHFSYDPVGNRTTDAKTSTNTWQYNKNNELQSFDTTSFKYNLNGQMTEKTVNGTNIYYSYNLDGQLKEIKDNSSQVVAQYKYDPFGRRLSKTLPQENKVIYFYYSDEGMVGEYDQTGNIIQSYGYKPDSQFTTDPVFTQRPDFILKAKGGYVYHINDHLGTPQKLITETGRKVWEASSNAFGKTVISNNEFRNPLGFPGQYTDTESTLLYNRWRYYDPQLGRYTRNDPIGLVGGINTYVYVKASAVNLIDPSGLINNSLGPTICPRGTDCIEPHFEPTPDGEGVGPSPQPPGSKNKQHKIDCTGEGFFTLDACTGCCNSPAGQLGTAGFLGSGCVVKCYEKFGYACLN